MHEVKMKKSRMKDGTELTVFSREITDANILSVEAGTTGYKGGDTGHGGRTYFRIEDLASTDIKVKALGEDGDKGLAVMLGGDTELTTIIKALKFIVKVLEEEANDADGD
jgi:hypothetical protein